MYVCYDCSENVPSDIDCSRILQHIRKRYTVHVLDCLSKTAFAEVMAHELLHLWLYDHSLVPSKRITEGFCNLGSFEVLSGIQTDKAKVKLQNIISNSDSVYGEGFRVVKQVYDVEG